MQQAFFNVNHRAFCFVKMNTVCLQHTLILGIESS